ncbi:MAG: hypothetical protein KJZ78_18065 [Bryobacteraceae bacterium]|nr:hypothetical protein [Bryobacteraceae bacterium]
MRQLLFLIISIAMLGTSTLAFGQPVAADKSERVASEAASGVSHFSRGMGSDPIIIVIP